MASDAYTYEVRNISGVVINDVTESVNHFSKTSWTTKWPGGYGILNTRVNRDVLRSWQVKPSFTLVVYRYNRIMFQGEIQPPKNNISATSAGVTVTANGFFTVLQNQLRLRKRWIDDNIVGSDRLEEPASRIINAEQRLASSDISDDRVDIRIVVKDRILTSGTRTFWQLYELPTNSIVKKVDYSYRIRTGEGLAVDTYNEDQAATEDTLQITSTGGADGTNSITFTQGDTNSFTFRFGPQLVPLPAPPEDEFDQNDTIQLYAIVVFSNYNSTHSAFGSEAYTTGELIEDVLLSGNATARISSDFDGILEPGTILSSFITENDKAQLLGDIISFLAAYSDAQQNTYGATVWDETGTSDNKPKFFLEKRTLDDWEYEINQQSGGFSVSLVYTELFNWIILERVDDRGITRYITPDDNSILKDDDSIDEHFERQSQPINCGQSTEANALDIGTRYLEYHKQPLRQAAFIIKGTITKKGGGIEIDAGQVRAGQRIKVLDFGVDENGNRGEVFFLRGTSYNSETLVLTATSDLPPNTISTSFFRASKGFV